MLGRGWLRVREGSERKEFVAVVICSVGSRRGSPGPCPRTDRRERPPQAEAPVPGTRAAELPGKVEAPRARPSAPAAVGDGYGRPSEQTVWCAGSTFRGSRRVPAAASHLHIRRSGHCTSSSRYASSALLHDIGERHSTESGSLPVGRKVRQPVCGIAMFILCSP